MNTSSLASEKVRQSGGGRAAERRTPALPRRVIFAEILVLPKREMGAVILFYLPKGWPLEGLKRGVAFPPGLFLVVPADGWPSDTEIGVTERRTSGPLRFAPGAHRIGRGALPSSTKRAQ